MLSLAFGYAVNARKNIHTHTRAQSKHHTGVRKKESEIHLGMLGASFDLLGYRHTHIYASVSFSSGVCANQLTTQTTKTNVKKR